jgi:hypothetical protein
MQYRSNGSIFSAIILMFVISLILFWLPLLGPFIAGFVGGRKAGSFGSAITAVFLPSIIFAILLFSAASSISGLPLIGMIAGGGGFILAVTGISPLFLGAIIGGATAVQNVRVIR